MHVSVSLLFAFMSKIPLDTGKHLESSVETPCNPKRTKDCEGGTRHVGGFATLPRLQAFVGLSVYCQEPLLEQRPNELLRHNTLRLQCISCRKCVLRKQDPGE